MKKLILILASLLTHGSFAQITTGSDIAVTSTQSGQVRGYIHNEIFTYKGIPYATAKRFEEAKPVSWEGIRSSLTYGPVCPLPTPTTSVSDEIEFVFDHNWGFSNEDCLSLNIWTPGIKDGKKRPVLFWIHGGGFTSGSSIELPSYDGENLAKRGDVVVVSINHRLNFQGFLNLSKYGEKYKTSANNSILDMQKALEWVNKNIGNFGGDPGNVTIFGQSGGGAKVNTLMAMPKAKGLFHKAINQSGAFRGNMLTEDITAAIGEETLKNLGISAENIDEIQTVPFETLSKAASEAIRTVGDDLRKAGKGIGGFGLSWGPSVDGNLLPYQLLDEDALQLSKNIPLMIGSTINEFMPSLGTNLSFASEDKVIEWINNTYKDKADDYLKAVKKALPRVNMPSDLMDIDTRFRPGAVYQANVKSSVVGGAPVYMYLFDWQSPVLDGKYKAIHCMDLCFVFDNVERCEEMIGGFEPAYQLADKMSNAWINFARTGNPNHPGLPNWPAYTKENTLTMHFDNTCTVKPQMDKELLEIISQN